MDTSYAYDSYRAHDLSISMKTSSGDVIEMDFSNQNSASISQSKNEKGSSTLMSFSSMQSFSFKVQSNGITAEDQKEINAFMKQAQPYVDDFLKELHQDAPKSPVTKLAQSIADIFQADKPRDENHKNHAKSSIVDMFDNSMRKLENDHKENLAKNKVEKENPLDMEKMLDKIFKEAQKLLEKTLQEFDLINKKIYA